MKQDLPREQLPKGACWSMVDWIPEFGAPLAKRGGWSRPFNVLSTGSYMTGIGFAPFTGGTEVMAWNDAGTMFTSTPGSVTTTSRGATAVPAHPPVFYNNHAIFAPLAGTGVPWAYAGGGGFLGVGSAPNASLVCAYKNLLLVARSSALTRRIWFSGSGDFTSWNTTDPGGRWVDATYPVFGMAALRNMVVLFSEGFTERLVGSIPPSIAGSDMEIQPLHSVGCADPGSIAVTDDSVVYANADGVYVTDGVALADITAEGGIKQLWQTLLSGYASTWTIAGSVHRGRYIVSVMDGSTFKCSFMCDIRRRVWSRLTNINALMMVSSPVGIPNTPPSVYFADRSSLFVGDLATIFTPSATYKNDGNSTAVTPVLETGYFFGKQGRKRWRRAYAGYYMTDAASDNPVLTMSYATDLSTGSYTAVSQTFPETTIRTRGRVDVNVASEGLAFKIAQTNASAVTNLHSLEAETLTSERSRS